LGPRGSTMIDDCNRAYFRSRVMAKRLISLDQIFGRHSGCKQCQYKCVYRDAANHILSNVGVMKYFNKFIFGTIDSSDNFISNYPGLKEIALSEIKSSLKKEEDFNDLMFCFLINAGEDFIQNRGRQYSLPPHKTYLLLNGYNNLINSFFSIPIKTQLSIDAEKYLKEFQRCYKETFLIQEGPFPGCNEFCKLKCLFRHDIKPFVIDIFIDEKYKKVIKSGEHAKENARKFCLNIAKEITFSKNSNFLENIGLCFFIQKSIQDSVKEVILNIKKWFLGNKGEN